jgi:hypothetical protein
MLLNRTKAEWSLLSGGSTPAYFSPKIFRYTLLPFILCTASRVTPQNLSKLISFRGRWTFLQRPVSKYLRLLDHMFSVPATQLCSCTIKQPHIICKPVGVTVPIWLIYWSRQQASWVKLTVVCWPDLINCSASYSIGSNPNSFPWPRNPSKLIWLLFTHLRSILLHATLTFTVLKHYATSIPISGSLTCCSLQRDCSSPDLPLAASVHFFREALTDHPNGSVLTPRPKYSNSHGYFLPITYQHLKNTICCTYTICLPWELRLICSLPRIPASKTLPDRGSMSIWCLNCYCHCLTPVISLYPHYYQ